MRVTGLCKGITVERLMALLAELPPDYLLLSFRSRDLDVADREARYVGVVDFGDERMAHDERVNDDARHV